MKASPNREQMLFLIAGGIILLLILLVVTFQMIGAPEKLVVEDVTPPRPKLEMAPETPDVPARKVAKPLPSSKPEPEGVAPVFRSAVSAHKDDAPTDKTGPVPVESPEPVAETPRDVIPPVKARAPAPGPAPVIPAPLTAKSDPAPVKKVETPPPAPTPAPVKKAEPPPPAPPPVKKADPSLAEIASGEGFTVQIGSFSQRENAESVSQRVRSLGLPVFLQSVDVKGVTYLRVRAGPFATRVQADEAGRLVRSKAGISGTVVPSGN